MTDVGRTFYGNRMDGILLQINMGCTNKLELKIRKNTFVNETVEFEHDFGHKNV